MYASVLFLGGTSVGAVQSVVAVERTVFHRERAAGMYSALPYAFAQVTESNSTCDLIKFRVPEPTCALKLIFAMLQVAIEVVYVFIQTFIYSIILFTMIGFPWQIEKFLLYFFFVFMCFVYFTLYGMMLVALTPNFQIAAITMSFFLGLWNLFSGFLIPRTVKKILHTAFLYLFSSLSN